jgi:hypothetical protein
MLYRLGQFIVQSQGRVSRVLNLGSQAKIQDRHAELAAYPLQHGEP